MFDDNKLYIHIEPFCDEVEKKLQSFVYIMLFKEYLIENMDFKIKLELLKHYISSSENQV